MNEAFRIATEISTPLALLALVAMAALFGWFGYLKHQQKQLKELPEADRARAVDNMLSRYKLDIGNATREQKVGLVIREMDHRANRFRFAAIVAAVVTVLLFLIAAVAYAFRPQPAPSPAAPPTSFSFTTAERWSDARLPSDIFGEAGGKGRPREWMEQIEFGACSQLEIAENDASLLWYLSDEEFPHGLATFPLHVCVGTKENAIVTAYLVLPDERVKLSPLLHADEQGPRAQYVFTVPESRVRSKILVFVAMKADVYEAIKVNPKFHMRSQPLSPS